MKHIVFILCVGGLLGCTTVQQTTNTLSTHILFQPPLPEFPRSISYPIPKLEIAFLVDEDGSVLETKLLKGSGDEIWDAQAQASMLKWKFAPIYKNNKPAQMWIRLKVNIKFEDPVIITLAEIMCSTLKDADSIYKSLIMGQDFGELAIKHSIATSRENRGYLGKLDINSYPNEIKQILSALPANKFTEPLPFGDNYVIFKRIKEE